jgi:VCBS repeat-containing protein
VVINSNGTFSYTIDKSYSYYHGAAKIGASGTAVADSFSATATDAFGGSTTYSVSVSIYAVNDVPSLSNGVSWSGSSFLGTYGYYTSVSGSDDDNDSLTYTITAQPQNGSASYNSGTQILSTSGTKDGNTVTLTVSDGYYVVGANGVVTSTPSSSSKTYTIHRGV